MITKTKIHSSSFIGIYVCCNNEYAVIPPNVDKTIFEDILKVETINAVIGNSSLIGSMMVMNQYGAVVIDSTEPKELKFLDLPYAIIKDKINAVGNDILANDYCAMVHPSFNKQTIKEIEDILNVEVVPSKLAGLSTVGSVAVVTNKGMLVNPNCTDDEIKNLKEIFKVPVNIATANYGKIYLGASVVANDNGAIVGIDSTSIEINRIEEGLDII